MGGGSHAAARGADRAAERAEVGMTTGGWRLDEDVRGPIESIYCISGRTRFRMRVGCVRGSWCPYVCVVLVSLSLVNAVSLTHCVTVSQLYETVQRLET